LGYGQSNFNYVFNEYYDPRLYAQEQWFDRSHNIFFDWLVTGGFLGLLAYLSIFVAAVYYLFIQPFRKGAPETFTVIERGILLGLLAGYFTHNFVVFDNIVSYIFFAITLGLIH
jgi:O-antigen ligase